MSPPPSPPPPPEASPPPELAALLELDVELDVLLDVVVSVSSPQPATAKNRRAQSILRMVLDARKIAVFAIVRIAPRRTAPADQQLLQRIRTFEFFDFSR
ncbi:hypothetical protein [Sorangium sp. So ce363]|uniref:hypothetical protein n=1 Tax=Sorangium sp. So ce363 TaxID=3133304 RepID=UPI003F5E517F